MAKRLVTREYCDRCPVNKAKPATHVGVPFGFGDTRWKISLCDQHYDMLSRDMYAWGLLAEAVEEQHSSRRFTEGYVSDMRRVSELRTKHTAEDRAFTTAPPIDLPRDYKLWTFTEHALERMEEREVDAVDVLWTCANPTFSQPGREKGLIVHQHQMQGELYPLRVVLDPVNKRIVTVAWRDENERKAVGL